MKPRRRGGQDLGSVFTFGGRIPGAVGALLVSTLVATIAARTSPAVAYAAPLVAERIWSGEVWRLVSWAFVQNDPFTLIFVGLMLWWLGGQLAFAWGERTFLLRTLVITAGASAVVALVALVFPEARAPHLGAWPTMNALLVAWAMRYPDAQVNIWGVLPVTGRTLAIGVVAGTVLYAVFGGLAGFGAFLPHFAAMGIAYVMTRGLSLSSLLGRARRSAQERQARRRAKHLKVVKKNGPDDPPRWVN
jgi:membrane associated rhomboid family serine protease